MPVVIKRYRNRKLYDTQTKRYITLEGIKGLIKNSQEIMVVDNRTGKDITGITLRQIILEVGKDHSGYLPIKLLTGLVRSGGTRVEEIRRNVFHTLNLYHHYDLEIQRRINFLIERGELSNDEGNALLAKLLSVDRRPQDAQYEEDGKILRYLWSRQIPTQSDLQGLSLKLEQLARRVNEYRGDVTG